MKTSLRRLLLLLAVWACAAVSAGAFKLFLHLPPSVVPLLIASLTIGFSVALVHTNWLRGALDGVSVRTILSVHLVRFLGLSFLVLAERGRLPVEFAQRAGWGDIVAALAALVFLFFPEGAVPRRALWWWNLFGAADLLLAVGTAGWLNFTRPGSMVELSSLPLTLVPLFFVPVLMATHVHLLRRHFRERTARAPACGPVSI